MNVMMIRLRFVDPDLLVTAIPDVSLAVVGERGDTTRARTNGFGLLTLALPPGRYRAHPERRQLKGSGQVVDKPSNLDAHVGNRARLNCSRCPAILVAASRMSAANQKGRPQKRGALWE